jgi:type II secretory pathway pseudopilin PulG
VLANLDWSGQHIRHLNLRRHITSAFTVLELMLVVMIVLLVIAVATPSIRGMRKDRDLHDTYEKFEKLVNKAQENAITQQRTWVLVWEQTQILLQPDAPTAEEREAGHAEGSDSMTFGEGELYTINRPASLLPPKDTPGEWPFWRSGTCEPVTIAYEGPPGIWTANFSPLTGHGDIVLEEIR